MPFEVPTTETSNTNGQQDFPYTSSSQPSFSGFQKLHLVPGDSSLGGAVFTYDVSSEKKIRFYGSGVCGATLKESTAIALRWSPAYDEYQTGSVGTESGGFAAGQAKWTYRVDFPHVYSEPPQVVTCFHYFDMASNKPWRLTCKATDIDTKGFTAHVNAWGDTFMAWGDTFMNTGYLHWFAHPSDLPLIASSFFGETSKWRDVIGRKAAYICTFR